MPSKTVLIPGGAGFIGAHVVNELLEHGYHVRVLDSLVPQIHGPERKRPSYLSPEAELIVGDIRDSSLLRKSLTGVDAVVNLVALVGVGQSMYQIEKYTATNNGGTAALMQALTKQPVETVVVASSMSIYGEGLYKDANNVLRNAPPRNAERMKAGNWELFDEQGQQLIPVPTPENKTPALASVYALSKYDQEKLTLILSPVYGMRAVALRFFNTYGPYQALSNPYTGVLSNFAARVLNGKAPLIYEDGNQKRDFVSVYDVAGSVRLAIETPEAAGHAINISSGQAMSVRDVAEKTMRCLGSDIGEPEITGKYRVGDIRHCVADISRARQLLGWAPHVSLERGLEDLASWLEGQEVDDRGVKARQELSARGLML